MSSPLFSNIPSQDQEIVNLLKSVKIASLVMCAVSVILGFLAFAEGDHSTENAIFVSVVSLALIFLFGILYIDAICTQRQSLLVYDDRILFKQGLSKKEREIRLTPSDYKIKVKNYVNRGGAMVHLIFMDGNNRRLFRYVTPYSTRLKKRLKYELRTIGCEIINPKNRF